MCSQHILFVFYVYIVPIYIIYIHTWFCIIYSEYGDSWHKGGMLANKQNVFDDFVAAAEYLIQNKYTNPSRLVSLDPRKVLGQKFFCPKTLS